MMMEYPKMMYRTPGPHNAGRGQSYDYVVAQDAADRKAAIEAGWHDSLDDALSGGKPADPALTINPVVDTDQDDDSPPTRAELEQMATRLGLRFDGRTSDAKLADRIARAIDGLDKAPNN